MLQLATFFSVFWKQTLIKLNLDKVTLSAHNNLHIQHFLGNVHIIMFKNFSIALDCDSAKSFLSNTHFSSVCL